MEYIVDKENTDKKLSDDEKNQIAKIICDNFKTYNDARDCNLKQTEKLINEIYFKKDFSNITDKNEKWKSKIKLCKQYMFFQTLKSFIWKNTYSGINSMFDVSGESLESDNNSNKQKAMLVDILEKMKYGKISDTVIDNALIYGELIAFCSWKKNSEEYRRPISFFESVFKDDISKLFKVIQAKATGKKYYIDEKTTYDNPDIVAVNPANFVFDTSQSSNFDNCPKIHKTWRTPEDIINNKYYSVSKKVATELRNLIKNHPNISDISDQSDEYLKDKQVNNSTIELLEHWGNFTMPDGKVLKNWHIVIAGGKYLIRFAKNQFVINPFTYGAFFVDPITGRGISLLTCVSDLCEFQETLMNKTLDLQSLTENPPMLAPKEFFEDDEVNLYPGKIITFDTSLYTHSLIQPMSFNSGVFLQDIQFLNDLMCEISGIYPNMMGAPESGSKTATEISVKTQGQTTRLSMILDVINQDYIIPCVTNIAKLVANFKFGNENIFLNKENNPENVLITDEIRQSEYRYTYSDRNSISERFNFADMLVLAVERFGQMIPLNVEQIFVWYLSQKGVENPERFLAKQNATPSPMGMNDLPIPTQHADTDGSLPQASIV